MATEQQENEFARRMLEKSDAILAEVDRAYIIKDRGHKVRAMPTFRPEEISLGRVLGTGGFGIVNEIKGFFLDKGEDQADCQTQAQSEEDSNEEVVSALIQNNPQDIADATSPLLPATGLRKRNGSETKLTDQRAANVTDKATQAADLLDAHIHYDVKQAKEVMSKRAVKCGRGRYALKRLHADLSQLERARGMIDLAVEAKYLSVVWHPNIST
jgi:hypothetical protein